MEWAKASEKSRSWSNLAKVHRMRTPFRTVQRAKFIPIHPLFTVEWSGPNFIQRALDPKILHPEHDLNPQKKMVHASTRQPPVCLATTDCYRKLSFSKHNFVSSFFTLLQLSLAVYLPEQSHESYFHCISRAREKGISTVSWSKLRLNAHFASQNLHCTLLSQANTQYLNGLSRRVTSAPSFWVFHSYCNSLYHGLPSLLTYLLQHSHLSLRNR